MTELQPSSPREVAIAILYQSNHFLLQLRDDIPTIPYPGHWAFFGGHIELGESPDDGITRELQEEINHVPSGLTLYRSYFDTSCPQYPVIRHVYHAPLVVPLTELSLNEGWDIALVSHDAIRQGWIYSDKAQKECPIGSPHQALLLSFIENVRQPSHSLQMRITG